MSAAETVLGKLAGATSVLLQTHGWQKTIETLRGEPNVADSVSTLLHKASRILEYLRTRGAPVLTSTPPWTQQKERDRAIDRGPHKSSHGERDFVVAEMLEFCEQGYWLFVPYHNVCDLSGLRISPLGVVPQRDRRPQLIVDYTFSNVNQETVPLAPREAIQFGRALYRVIHNIVGANPRYGPVYMSKIDISDGFYRIWVAISDIPKLDVALPVAPGQTPLVTFPLALPMGWIESPPFFTITVTETLFDLSNAKLSNSVYRGTEHRLEQAAATLPVDLATQAPPQPRTLGSNADNRKRPVANVDIYVDNFLLQAQTQRQRDRVLRATLHSIDKVFRTLEAHDPAHRKELASMKKLLKGDAAWSTHKRMLGWDIDATAMTLNLPPHRVEQLREVLS